MLLRAPFSPQSRPQFALIGLVASSLLAILPNVVRAGGPLRHLAAHHCNGGCGWLNHQHHGGEVLPVADGFVQEVVDFDTESALQEVVLEFPVSPQLTITNINGLGSANSDVQRFDKIVYGELECKLNLLGAIEPLDVRWILDGEQMHPELPVGTNWILTDEGYEQAFIWSCPPLGRHTLQAQLTMTDGRVASTRAIAFEVVAPQRPEIVAVGDPMGPLQPIREGQVVTAIHDHIRVQFAAPNSGAIYLHVKGHDEILGELTGENCCYSFPLKDALTVGRHALHFYRKSSQTCPLSSEMSASLWVQYEPTDGLVYKGMECFTFDAPAYFTRKGYAYAGQEDARSGLVLMEGMEFGFHPNDGRWTLRIPYEQPTIPVTLRLQLQYKAADRWKTLTIPPICFTPGDVCESGECSVDSSNAAKGNCGAEGCGNGFGSHDCGWPVKTIHGYSAVLKHAKPENHTELRRRGTATFGYGHEGLRARSSY